MDFVAVVDQVIALLRQRGRVTYSTLKRQFQLDDAALEDVKNELIEGQRLAVDERGNVLVWTGAPGITVPTDAAAAGTPALTPLTYTPPYLAEKILTSKSALAGERKQVTVLFADLKGSMELLADRDPEDARQLLDPVLERMMAAVHRYEGTVNQVMGDGIMALFGAPIAHDDHAVRACYAALAMQEFVQRYAEEVRRTQGLTVQIRVGLNAGEVVVRAIGNDLHMDYSAIGQTTHLAARLEQLATPDSILLTATTLRLVEGLVQVKALGPVPIRGLAEPVDVFELVGASALRGRFQARVAGGLTRFVGRDAELAALQYALQQAGSGHGQVVAVGGEAGVGKSRLIYEFVHSHRTQGWLVLESTSVSYGKATPYFPVLDLLRRYCHLEDGDDSRTIRAKVTGQVLTLDDTLQDTLPALLALLDALQEENPFLRLDPPQRRQRTLDALKRVLLCESQVQPLVLVFEDLHWIDTETQALLDSLVESLPTARVLLLVNYRPEYQHSWGSTAYYTPLRLDPLPPASAHALLQALLGDDPSLAPLTQFLIARTQGNPFFLEESVHTLVETQVLVGEGGAYRLATALPSIQVPALVQAVVAARIDRLPLEEKQLLQMAAVIGTEVPLSLLQAIAELPEDAMHSGLAHLQAAEFLYETRLFPEREYTFKHALTHEVAYGSLLQERRRVLHARIVEALEGLALAGGQLGEQVERLAHHALRGEMWAKALRYYRQASAKAMARSALREVVICCEQALTALQHLPESRDTLEQAIDLRFDPLRHALWQLGEHQRILDHLQKAKTLAEALDDPWRLGWALSYMTNGLWLIGDNIPALASGQRALGLTSTLKDVALQLRTNLSLAQVYHALGDYRRATDLLKNNVASLQGALLWERFGQAGLPSVLSRSYLLWCLAECGEFTTGITCGEEAMRIAAAVDRPYELLCAYRGVGLVYLRQGDFPKAISALEYCRGLCHIVPGWSSLIASFLGYAYALVGHMTAAMPLLKESLEQAAATSFMVGQALWVAHLSEGYLLAGRIEDVPDLALRALQLSRDRKERGHEAWVLRLLGEIAAQSDSQAIEQADTFYRQALTLAKELDMRPLQAHCHRGLGTLYAMTGQQEQARTELSTAIAMYQSMDMTFWLPQTETALAQVDA